MLLFFNPYFFSSAAPTGQATGGTITTSGSYTIHTFTTSGTFAVLNNALACDILVVAGGGGGGNNWNGGGGGGGVQYFTNQNVTPNTSYTVTVGAGGVGGVPSGNRGGANGQNSQFGSLTASIGGGGGGGNSTVGGSGGSGGGGGGNGAGAGGAGTSGQGNAGGAGNASGPGGGGGGAGGAGALALSTTVGGLGGAGIANSITGTLTYYGGGGGGAGGSGGGGAGGLGGGGAGSTTASNNGTDYTGGGGGAITLDIRGGGGGSGIVIVRYLTAAAPVYLMDYVSAIANATGLYACKRLLTSYLGPIMRLTDPATVLLLHGDNPSTNSTAVAGYIDSSSSNNFVTATGSVTYSTTPTPLPSGTSCMTFNGSNSNYLTVPVSKLALGATDFTIEFWLYLTSNSGNPGIIGTYTTTNTTGWQVYIYTPTGLCFGLGSASNVLNGVPYGSLNAWHHHAFVRKGTTFTYYLDGTLNTTVTNATYNTTLDTVTTGSMYINNIGTNGNTSIGPFNGYLDEIRISKGVARYTANFTPAAFPGYATSTDLSFPNVALLLHCDGNNGVAASSSAYYDSSPIRALMTVTGTPTFNSGQKKFGVSSLNIAGSSYLQTPTNTNYTFGSKDFTIEFWMYVIARPSGNGGIMGNNIVNTSTGAWLMYMDSSGGIQTQFGGYQQQAGSTTLNFGYVPAQSTGTWIHYAFVRNGTNATAYVNGTIAVTASTNWGTISIDSGSGSNTIVIGQGPPTVTTSINAYLDDVRVTIGTARYTTNFSVPTTAFPDLPQGTVATDFYSDPNGNLSVGSANGISYTSWATTNQVAFAPVLTWYDQSGKANHAASIAGSWPVYDPANNLLDFSTLAGSYGGNASGNNFMSLPDGTVQNGASPNFTITASHGKRDTAQINTIIFSGTPGNNTISMSMYPSTNTPANAYFMNTWGTNPATATNSVEVGNIVTFAYNGSSVTQYINGVSVLTTAVGLNVSSLNNAIGYIPTQGQYMNGQINFISVFNSVLSATDQAIVEAQGNYFDPYYYNTVLLLKGDSQISSTTTTTTIVDSSLYNATLTNTGTTVVSLGTYPNANKIFANAMLFNGSSSVVNSIVTPISSLYTFGTNDITIEFWMYPTANFTDQMKIISQVDAAGTGVYWMVFYYSGSLQFYSGGTLCSFTCGAGDYVNKWTHVAVIRQSNVFKIYVNGIVGSNSTTNTLSLGNSTQPIRVGHAVYTGLSYFTGYLDDVRVTNGVARYTGNFNVPVGPSSGIEIAQPIATGGTMSGPVTIDGVQYMIHQFLQTGTSTFRLNKAAVCDILVVGGGGGGGGTLSATVGSGGGAGGFQYFTSQSLVAGSYTVTVGAGGPGGTGANPVGTAGNNSQFGSLTASVGGGYGTWGDPGKVGGNGGSGGGGATGPNGFTGLGSLGGTGTAGQGNNGGQAYTGPGTNYGTGGGGGAGAVGGIGSATVAGSGGIGLLNNITGNSVYYASGGGGGTFTAGTAGNGGFGGGGAAGAAGGNNPGISATANTGGGGGGASNIGGGASNIGGAGGSGIVIVRYPVGPTATIINGSIEIPAIPFNQVARAGIADTYTSNLAYCTNWTFTGYCGLVTATSAGANLSLCSVPPVNGNQSIWAQYTTGSPSGTATTTLRGLTYGYQYILSYFYARRTGYVNVNHTVKLNGNVIKIYQNDIGSDVSWTYDSYSFIATNSVMNLVITSGLTSGTDQTMIFDNFTVTADTTSSLAWPPGPLTDNSTTLSGQTYGNGSYVAYSSSEYNSSFSAYYAFDKATSSSNRWAANNAYTSGAPNTGITTPNLGYGTVVDIQFPSAIKLTSYSFTTYQLSPNDNPAAWTLGGSNDGGTTYTLLDTRSGYATTLFATSTTATFTVSPSTSYSKYRVVITACNPANGNCSLAEIIYYGSPPTTPTPLPAYTTTNLLGYWDFGVTSSYSGSGTTVNDLSGNGRTMTITGSCTYNASGALSLSIPSSAAYCATSSSYTLDFTNGASYEALINVVNASSGSMIISYTATGASSVNYIQYYNVDSKVHCSIGNASYGAPMNTWYHIVFTINSSGSTIYVNGTSVATGTGGTFPASYSAPIYLGNYHSGNTAFGLNGKIAMARFYNNVLTAGQVQANYVNAINKVPGNPYGLQ